MVSIFAREGEIANKMKHNYEAINTQGAINLAKAVVQGFITDWLESSVSTWTWQRERFLNNNPNVLFWFVLAEREDLFYKLQEQFKQVEDIARWRKEHISPHPHHGAPFKETAEQNKLEYYIGKTLCYSYINNLKRIINWQPYACNIFVAVNADNIIQKISFAPRGILEFCKKENCKMVKI